MKAVYAADVNPEDPMSALAVGELPAPAPIPGWCPVSVRAVSVNHHDLWSLRGVGLSAKQTPMTLGTDAAGVLEEDVPGKGGPKAGDEVVLYTSIWTSWTAIRTPKVTRICYPRTPLIMRSS